MSRDTTTVFTTIEEGKLPITVGVYINESIAVTRINRLDINSKL